MNTLAKNHGGEGEQHLILRIYNLRRFAPKTQPNRRWYPQACVI